MEWKIKQLILLWFVYCILNEWVLLLVHPPYLFLEESSSKSTNRIWIQRNYIRLICYYIIDCGYSISTIPLKNMFQSCDNLLNCQNDIQMLAYTFQCFIWQVLMFSATVLRFCWRKAVNTESHVLKSNRSYCSIKAISRSGPKCRYIWL